MFSVHFFPTMSLAAPSFQIFRSCRASFSSRALTRPSLGRCPTRLSRVGTRCYSEEKTSEGRPSSAQDEAAKESSKDDAPAQGDPCAEVRSSLKAKEAEVSDLTVRISFSLSASTSLPNVLFSRVDYDICKLTFLTCNEMRQEKRNRPRTMPSHVLRATY